MMNAFRRQLLAASSVAMILASGPTQAQQTTVLTTLWEVLVPNNDYMSTFSTTERDTYTNRGAFMYVPYSNLTSTNPLYRLFLTPDHMDSDVTNEAGYANEGILGYPWNASTVVRGITLLNRVYNPTTGDHAEIRSGDAISGYTVTEAPDFYAYPRYNNVAEDLLTLSAGDITIKSNKVAGGAIWSWVWNSIEFIDNADYGRELQVAIDWTENSVVHNPTEAGSMYSTSSVVGNRQGSPIYQASNSGSTQTTRAIPLEWDPTLWGGTATNPVIYSAMLLGKDITLNYNNMPQVAQYVSHLTLASSLTAANWEAPTGYMPSSFNRYYTYDASSQTLTEVYPSNCGSSPTAFAPSSGHGGVIISNSAQTAAMAVGAKTTAASGPIASFGLYDCRSSGSTSKWNAYTGHVSRSSGVTSITTYVTTGTLANVTANLRQLFVDGAI